MNVRETPKAVARAVEWEFAHSTYAQVLAEIPATLFPYWSGTAHHEFPGIPRDASFYAQSVEGLMMFFDCVAASGRTCALPSRAADSAWHAWGQMDTASLERFCIRHFGQTIPHVEKARMQDPMARALAVCLVTARRRASQPAAGSHLPRLFSLDGQLGMPRGFGYRMIDGLVACSALDEFGNPEDKVRFPGELTPHALLLASLVSEAEYAEAARLGLIRDLRPAAQDSSVSSVALSTAFDIGGDCGDGDGGDSDGAASCGGGSSCGGGCGGGGCGS